MGGWLKTWKVSGITHSAAMVAEPWYRLGYALEHIQEFERLSAPEKAAIIAAGHQFVVMQDCFEEYFNSGIRSQYESSVKFLVLLAAVLMGIDNTGWQWPQARNLSQGLWGSMDETPTEFIRHNVPLIVQIRLRIESLIRQAIPDNERKGFAIARGEQVNNRMSVDNETAGVMSAEPGAVRPASYNAAMNLPVANTAKKWHIRRGRLCNSETCEEFRISEKAGHSELEVHRDGAGYMFHRSSKYQYVNDWDIG